MRNFIENITIKYTNEFVSHLEGPILGLNTEYILRLSAEEVEALASEDESTSRIRRELNVEIEDLQRALAICEGAIQQTVDLGMA